MDRKSIKVGWYIAVLIMSLLVSQSPFISMLNGWILDTSYQVLRNYYPSDVEKDIVLVGIDEQSYATSDRPTGLWHKPLGEFIDALVTSQAKVIAFDVVLPTKKYGSLIKGHHKVLEKAVVKAKKAKVPLIFADSADIHNRKIRPYGLLESLLGEKSFATPLIPKDRDGAIRRYLIENQNQLPANETLAGKLFLMTHPEKKLGAPYIGQYIDYSVGEKFSYIPFHDVLELIKNQARETLTNMFNDKIVLVGDTTAYTDILQPAVALAGWSDQPNQPGVLIHAQAYRSFSHNGLLTPVNGLVIAALISILSVLIFVKGQFGRLFSLTTISVLLYISATYLITKGWVFHIAPLIFTVILAIFSAAVFDAIKNMQEKRRLKESFGKYVSPQILDKIVGGSITPHSKPENKNVSVLISDIRGFTNRSSSESAMNIVDLLNRYFDIMTQIVHRHNGTVDKFMGDGLLAFFGAPNDLENPALNSAAAALEMIDALEPLNASLKADGIAPIKIGIGISTGNAAVGHIGSSQRHEYTAIGSVVNIAARIESLTKELKRTVICDGTTAEAIKASFAIDPMGNHAIRGLDNYIKLNCITHKAP